ncbi:MAG TPA: metal-dependent transcriptional regulator [Candidatus Sulfotelmatobacter sp.]|nr:metal-dependent transcriptional regulator [Candidatus Sulfotelmatobacter sp.]
MTGSATPAVDGASPLTETANRYLETIYYIHHEEEVVRPGRLAEWLGVSAPTVTVSLQRLARAGWISLQADHSVRLTPAGLSAAADIVRRHRILERWLTDELGLDWATADQEAAQLSHAVSDLVLERLDYMLGNPATCPHGNLIPGRQPPPGGRMIRLTALPEGVRSRVLRISEVAEHEAPQLLSTLHEHGAVPGASIEVIRRDPQGVHARVAGRETALSSATAHAVWVEAEARRASDSASAEVA